MSLFSPWTSSDLKEARLTGFTGRDGIEFVAADLERPECHCELFAALGRPVFVHHARQAWRSYGFDDPQTYVDYNLVGFLNILERCRHQRVNHPM